MQLIHRALPRACGQQIPHAAFSYEDYCAVFSHTRQKGSKRCTICPLSIHRPHVQYPCEQGERKIDKKRRVDGGQNGRKSPANRFRKRGRTDRCSSNRIGGGQPGRRPAARAQHRTRESLMRKNAWDVSRETSQARRFANACSRLARMRPSRPATSRGMPEKQRPLPRSRSAATSSPPSCAPWPTGCACASGCSWALSPPARRLRCTRAPPQA